MVAVRVFFGSMLFEYLTLIFSHFKYIFELIVLEIFGNLSMGAVFNCLAETPYFCHWVHYSIIQLFGRNSWMLSSGAVFNYSAETPYFCYWVQYQLFIRNSLFLSLGAVLNYLAETPHFCCWVQYSTDWQKLPIFEAWSWLNNERICYQYNNKYILLTSWC